MPEDTAIESTPASFSPDSEEARARLDACFRLQHREVVRAVRPYTRDAATAEDLAQEAFLRLYQHYRIGRTVENVVAWTLAVARNLARDLMRRHSHEDVAAPEQWITLLETVPGTTDCCERVILDRESYERVRAVIDTLPPMQRNCVRLYGQGLTFKQIASRQGIPYHQAVVQTKYGIDRVKRVLAGRRTP
jgi:RNA polymerase sigma-70 factor (ECF subfamily)